VEFGPSAPRNSILVTPAGHGGDDGSACALDANTMTLHVARNIVWKTVRRIGALSLRMSLSRATARTPCGDARDVTRTARFTSVCVVVVQGGCPRASCRLSAKRSRGGVERWPAHWLMGQRAASVAGEPASGKIERHQRVRVSSSLSTPRQRLVPKVRPSGSHRAASSHVMVGLTTPRSPCLRPSLTDLPPCRSCCHGSVKGHQRGIARISFAERQGAGPGHSSRVQMSPRLPLRRAKTARP
jgi:hypothetical protein